MSSHLLEIHCDDGYVHTLSTTDIMSVHEVCEAVCTYRNAVRNVQYCPVNHRTCSIAIHEQGSSKMIACLSTMQRIVPTYLELCKEKGEQLQIRMVGFTVLDDEIAERRNLTAALSAVIPLLLQQFPSERSIILLLSTLNV